MPDIRCRVPVYRKKNGHQTSQVPRPPWANSPGPSEPLDTPDVCVRAQNTTTTSNCCLAVLAATRGGHQQGLGRDNSDNPSTHGTHTHARASDNIHIRIHLQQRARIKTTKRQEITYIAKTFDRSSELKSLGANLLSLETLGRQNKK